MPVHCIGMLKITAAAEIRFSQVQWQQDTEWNIWESFTLSAEDTAVGCYLLCFYRQKQAPRQSAKEENERARASAKLLLDSDLLN